MTRALLFARKVVQVLATVKQSGTNQTIVDADARTNETMRGATPTRRRGDQLVAPGVQVSSQTNS